MPDNQSTLGPMGKYDLVTVDKKWKACFRPYRCTVCLTWLDDIGRNIVPRAMVVKKRNEHIAMSNKRKWLYDAVYANAQILKHRDFKCIEGDNATAMMHKDPYAWYPYSKRIGKDWKLNLFQLETEGGIHFAFHHLAYVLLAPYVLATNLTLRSTLIHFITELNTAYNDISYHNSMHGANVGHLTACQFRIMGLEDLYPFSEKVIGIISALGHDAGHWGRNTAWLEFVGDPIHLIWKISPLEQYHAFLTLRALCKDKCNILASLTREDFNEARHLILKTIIMTDMASHAGQMKDFIKREPDFNPLYSRKDRLYFLQMSVKLADIGHPALPWEQHYEWSRRALVEFYEQGDELRHMKLYPISHMHDRELHMGYYEGQQMFIDYVVIELINCMNNISVKMMNTMYRVELLKQHGDAEENAKATKISDVWATEGACARHLVKWVNSSSVAHLNYWNSPEESRCYRHILKNLISNRANWGLAGSGVIDLFGKFKQSNVKMNSHGEREELKSQFCKDYRLDPPSNAL